MNLGAIELGYPLALGLLVFLPLLIERGSGGTLFQRREQPALAQTSVVSFSAIPPSTLQTLRAPALSFLRLAAFSLLVFALARPRTTHFFSEVETSGRDILLALDVSGSMQAMDFFIDNERVSRLAALEHVVDLFIDGRRGDRMGLVVFGAEAYTQCPLTLDHAVLKRFVDSLEIGMAGQGTAIGNALAVSLKQLRTIDSKSKVIILVTDGKNNSGVVTPTEAALLAKELGIKIHTIGIGSDDPAPMPVRGLLGTRLIMQDMEWDEEQLKEIAAKSGGE
ncbi:MAG: VWA domain-containing protein, partial [Bdellovibrionales bacterium]|nr:VWA domain-containing protein [Bdellovibrionales bacterium]